MVFEKIIPYKAIGDGGSTLAHRASYGKWRKPNLSYRRRVTEINAQSQICRPPTRALTIWFAFHRLAPVATLSRSLRELKTQTLLRYLFFKEHNRLAING